MAGRHHRPELDNPKPLPELLAYLWQWFKALDSGRGRGFTGKEPITDLQLHAFFTLRRLRPSSWELDVLRNLDNIALNAASGAPSVS